LLLKKPVCVSNTGMSYDSSVSDRARKNAKFEYLDYQIPVTQFKGPKGAFLNIVSKANCK